MNTKRNQILTWHAQGQITDLDKALSTTQSQNTPKDWHDFINQSMLWLGSVAIAIGVIFFFAYNWNDISNATKFILIQSLIGISALLYTQTIKYSSASTATLLLLALLIGALFALFGQTYQTGKDPWQLFFIWMLVITPISYISRSVILWVFCLALANLTLNLVLEVRYGWFGTLWHRERDIILYVVLNGVTAVLFEMMFITKRLYTRVAAQISVVATMISISWMAVYTIFDMKNHAFETLFYLLWMTAIYYYYRVKTLDVLVLSSWVVSGIVFTISLVGRNVDNDYGGGIFLLFTVLIIGLSAAGGKWLIGLLKQSNQGEDAHEQ